MPKQKEKVLAYIVRGDGGGKELLVFDHTDFPEAGTQVPAGTVDPDESIEEALLREVSEESGLHFNTPGKFLGRFEWFRADRNELHFRNIYLLEAPTGLPNRWDIEVNSKDGDNGLRFHYFWIPLTDAPLKLSGEQGKYIEYV